MRLTSSQVSSGATDQAIESADQPANPASNPSPARARPETSKRSAPKRVAASVGSATAATISCSLLSSGTRIAPLAKAA